MDTEKKAKEIAGDYFKLGYNCSETVLRTFVDILNVNLSEDALKMASGFGGGVGQSGCMCGALAASTMVLGLLDGRSSLEQNRDPIYNSAKGFHNQFKEQFGATCCRALNKNPFGTKEHRVNCLKITGKTAEMLEEYIANRSK